MRVCVSSLYEYIFYICKSYIYTQLLYMYMCSIYVKLFICASIVYGSNKMLTYAEFQKGKHSYHARSPYYEI